MSRSKSRKVDASLDRVPAAPTDGRTVPSWLWPVLLLVAGAAVYANSFNGVFLFDNETHIVDNENIRTLWPPWHLLAHRRPVVETSLAINYALGELDPWGYHLVNVLIHLAAGLTLFGILRRTFSLEAFSRRVRNSASFLACCSTLLWLVHPLQTQSVTYVIQRGESLMGLFYLLTMYGVLRGATSPGAYRWYAMAIAACALGMGTKAVMVTAPVAVWVFDSTLLAGGPIRALRRRPWLYAGLVSTWLVLWCVGIVKGVLDPNRVPGTVGFSNPHVSWWSYLLTEPSVLLRYVQLSFWPVGQCLDYSLPLTKHLADAAPLGLIVIALLAFTIVALVKRRPIGVAGAWFFIVLAPTSSFIPIQDVIYEHRMYLPLASLAVLFVFGCHRLLYADAGAEGATFRQRYAKLGVVVLVVAVCLGIATGRRNRLYADALAMWQDVVAKRPDNARAHYALGLELQRAGRKPEAYREYERALELNPSLARPYNNLAVARLEQGRPAEAIALFRRGIELKPDFPEALANLGLALMELGRWDEAENALRRALQYQPNSGQAYYGLGRVYGERGDFDRAIASFEQATRLLPEQSKPWVWLGKSLAMVGRFPEAARAFEKALELNPGDATAAELLQRARAQ